MNKNKLIRSLFIIIAILVVIIVIMQQCNSNKEPEVIIKTNTIIKYNDTVYQEKIVNVPYEIIEYVDVPVYVDCDSLKKEHYAKVYYDKSFGTDSTVIIRIKQTLQQNKLLDVDLTYQIKQPTIIEETIITYDTCKECKQFNIGIGGLIGGYTDKFGAGGSIMLTTNKKASYSVSYDAINKIGYVGIYWNIR